MAHVGPHRWADAAAGRLTAAERRRLEAHAAACTTCAAEREEVVRTWSAFGEIREAEPPPLRWDHIGARIYWITSSERRAAAGAPPERRRWTLPAVALASLGLALLLYTQIGRIIGRGAPDSTHASQSLLPEIAVVPPAPAALSPPPPLEGLVTFLQGDVRRDGSPLAFDDLIVAGSRIETGQGKVAIQFGKNSGFTLAPSSSVVLSEFDNEGVVLAVEGELFVDVSRRTDEQSFVVITGEREIRVRGTAFRVVHRGGQLRVACGHGVIAISDGQGEEELVAGQVIEWASASLMRDAARLSEMARMQREVIRMPAWTDAGALGATSSMLAISGAPERFVKVDGVPIGTGSFRVRVMSGRHYVEAEGVPGKWVELDAGTSLTTSVRLPETTSARGKARRRAELMRALDQGTRIDACMRPVRKQGIDENAFIILEIGILRSGTIEYLNIVDTNLPRSTAQCVRNVVDHFGFGEGPAAMFRQRISL